MILTSSTPTITARITRIFADKGFAFALDDLGYSYLLYAPNFEQFGRWGFADLCVGAQVRFIPIDGPKGWRGVDVRVVSLD